MIRILGINSFGPFLGNEYNFAYACFDLFVVLVGTGNNSCRASCTRSMRHFLLYHSDLKNANRMQNAIDDHLHDEPLTTLENIFVSLSS